MSAIRRILCIDIGGTALKASVIDSSGKFLVGRLRVATPAKRQPKNIVERLVDLVKPLGRFDHVTIGFPGVVKGGRVISAPHLGTADWTGFELELVMAKKLGRPVKLLNDADVQGLAAIKGRGLELVCTLGTGLGTSWFRDGELMPHMDLAHFAIEKKNDFDVYIGENTRRMIGNRRWNQRVKRMITMMDTVFCYDRLYLGGGNSRWVNFKPPAKVHLVDNDAGIKGGAFVWTGIKQRRISSQADGPRRRRNRSILRNHP